MFTESWSAPLASSSETELWGRKKANQIFAAKWGDRAEPGESADRLLVDNSAQKELRLCRGRSTDGD